MGQTPLSTGLFNLANKPYPTMCLFMVKFIKVSMQFLSTFQFIDSLSCSKSSDRLLKIWMLECHEDLENGVKRIIPNRTPLLEIMRKFFIFDVFRNTIGNEFKMVVLVFNGVVSLFLRYHGNRINYSRFGQQEEKFKYHNTRQNKIMLNVKKIIIIDL